MSVTVIESDFRTLRQAYLEVKAFLETEVYDEEPLNLKTRLYNDLGCAGDDNYELLEKFVTKYNLDPTGFDYSKHFLSEGELFNSGTALLQLLILPIYLLIWVVYALTFGKVNLTRVQVMPDSNSSKLDMTFGDMLTWYLTGKYALRNEVQFVLKIAV